MIRHTQSKDGTSAADTELVSGEALDNQQRRSIERRLLLLRRKGDRAAHNACQLLVRRQDP
jgi:hypothetical protein